MTRTPDIERLIASAYSGLEPSVAVEEAIREGLSAERARPPRSRPVALLVPAGAFLAIAIAFALRPEREQELADDAGKPVPLVDFDNTEPGDGWAMNSVSLREGTDPARGRILTIEARGGKGRIRRESPVADWSVFRAVSIFAKVEANEPIEMRFLAFSGRAALVRRFTLQPGDWKEIVLPVKDFRDDTVERVCGLSRIEAFAIQWDKGAGAVTIDDPKLLPGKGRPTVEDRLALGFPKGGKSHESEHFVVMSDVKGLDLKKIAARLEAGFTVLGERYGLKGALEDKAPFCVFRDRKARDEFLARLGEHFAVNIGPTKADGFTVLGIATGLHDPKQGPDRPVFVHEATHAAIHRLLGVASNGNWVQEGLASAVQMQVFPKSRDGAETKKPPWAKLLAEERVPMSTYVDVASIFDFLAERHAEKLPAVWDALRGGREPLHKEGIALIAGALGTDPQALEAEWRAWKGG
jgi:hypothetical protein